MTIKLMGIKNVVELVKGMAT